MSQVTPTNERATNPEPPRRSGYRPGGGIPYGLLAFVAFCLLVAGAVALFGNPIPEPGPRETVFPLPAGYLGSYTDDWGAPRTQGSHEGTDLYAPEGTPVYAVTGGTVKLARGSKENGWNTLGGYTVMVSAGYDAGPVKRGDALYYAHLKSPSPLKPGDEVEAGQKIGEVGDTGGGPEGTTGRFPEHLHLGWYARTPSISTRDQAASGALNPYPLLSWISENSSVSQGGQVTRTTADS